MRNIIPSFYTVYDNQRDYTLGIICEARPIRPAPERAYEETEVRGRGTFYKDLGHFKDIEIIVAYNFLVDDPDEWQEVFHKVKRWLLGAEDQTLYFSDDLSCYYQVKRMPTILNTEQQVKRKGRFEASFICEGLPYVKDGMKEIEIGQSYDQFMNPYGVLAYPLYRITGNGACTFSCSVYRLNCEVDGELYIDSEKKLVYDKNGYQNAKTRGSLDKLYLTAGYNKFEVSEGFTLYITPRWRRL